MKRLGGAFSKLLDELVRERVGLASSRRHEQAKERVLGEAMKRAGVTDEAVYLALLKRDQRAFDALICDLTVPETYFFRDPPHYELLRREVLPALLTSRGREHVLEVWSAGCATGEEPYSLTILLEQQMLAHRSHVLGTDVSQRALARAHSAVYGSWSMRATNERDRERYFQASGRDYRLIERIRTRARFLQHSLTAALYPAPRSRSAGFDLILCRNVLIYFDPESTARTAQRLASSLSEDGWLMLGPSDPVLDIAEWCDTVTTPCGLLYRRHSQRQQRLPRRERSDAAPAAHDPAGRMAKPVTRRPSAAPPVRSASEPPGPSAADELDPRALLAQVQQLVSAYGPSTAEAGCRDLLGRNALSGALHLLHAMLLIDLARDAEAEQALRRALYLDRSLLIAQMLSATLQERRAEHAEAARSYLLLAQQAGALPASEPVLLGDGLTHAALAELAAQRARALKSRGTA